MQEHFEVFKKIVRNKCDWTRFGLPLAAEEIAKLLLINEPSKRLGAAEMGGPTKIREHKFFAPLDFVCLVKRGMRAPFVPYIDSPTDTRHVGRRRSMTTAAASLLLHHYWCCLRHC